VAASHNQGFEARSAHALEDPLVRFGTLRWHWERLGRRDPFGSVLTNRGKGRSDSDLEQFFRSGAAEIAAVLQRAARLGQLVSRRRALDFGCGVGRLTQAMAYHFERCDGVDISASMLRVARHFNPHAERCVYHRNVAPDLALFADASFNFVYSTLVLQHMDPRYSKGYIAELLRVLAPGGLFVFQLPSHRTEQEPSASATCTPIPGRLRAAAFKARLTADRSSLSVRAGELVTLGVTVENCSPHVWPALPNARGYRINLANHWLDQDGELVQRDDGRCPLPYDLAPGSRAELMLHVTAPPLDGSYWLELDLVQENVSWFAERGSEVLRISCRVAEGLPGPPPRCSTAEIVGAPEPKLPFRERHPRAFRVLRATGLRDVYWAWRRTLDGVKAHRDRMIERLIHPLVNWWKGRPFAPRMEMHCVLRSEVLAILAEGGGRLVDVEEDLMPGGFQNCRYWVGKG
jgi:SAM-dependent methyltransferase